MSIHLILLVAYSVALTIGGLWISRFVRNSGDFFVAGRGLSAKLLFATVLAANIGAGTTVGAAGLAYREGVSAWWWNGSAGLGSLALGFWIGPRIWRIAKERGFYTVGDFLEYRYSAAVRGVVAALIWVGTLAILAAQLLAGAAVLTAVADASKLTGVVIGAAAMTIYFAAGGLLSSAWVNLVQLVVLMAGFLFAMPLLYDAAGGRAAFESLVPPHPEYWNLMYSKGSGMSGWAIVAILTPAFIVSPGLVQKTYGAAGERAIRLGIGGQAVAQLVFGFVPVFFGIAALAAGVTIDNRDLALPTVLATELPPAVGALGLAAVFSAEVSTCDAILFMLATSLSKDLYKRFLNPAATDRQLLTVARIAAFAGGAGGVLLALQVRTIVDALQIFYSLLGVSLFVPVIAGLFWRRGGAPEAFASIVAGIGVLLIVRLATGGNGFGLLNENLAGLISAAAAFVLVATARGPRSVFAGTA